jgi:hypothetical protein
MGLVATLLIAVHGEFQSRPVATPGRRPVPFAIRIRRWLDSTTHCIRPAYPDKYNGHPDIGRLRNQAKTAGIGVILIYDPARYQIGEAKTKTIMHFFNNETKAKKGALPLASGVGVGITG